MRRLWLVAALAAASLHCGREDDPSPPDPNVDADRDGVVRAQDCNDSSPAVWQRLRGHRDADRDGRGAGATAEVCSGAALPAGWAQDDTDCDDADASRWWLGEAYADADGDGVGGVPLAGVCRGETLPPGWFTVGHDCAPDDGGAWVERAFLYLDGDRDGVTVASAGTVCAGAALPPGYATELSGDDCDDADAAVFVRTAAFRDADGDGRGGEAGTACAGASLPAGWVAIGGDCDDAEARAWRIMTAYRDSDGDGRGRDDAGEVCGDWGWLPPGWSSDWTDCDDADGSVWALKSYQYADRDGDGRAVSGAGTVCAVALPPELRYALGGWIAGDCDDADAARWSATTLYADVDGDGRGAGAGTTSCVGATFPAGFVTSLSDCAPEDATRWGFLQYWSRDLDGDGRSVPANDFSPYSSGTVCTGSALPAGYSTSSAAAPHDCDDADAALFAARQGAPDEDGDGWGSGPLAPVCSGAELPAGYGSHANDCATADPTLWRWTVLYPDADGDGVGAPPREIQCLGEDVPAGWSEKGWDSNDLDPGVQVAPGEEQPLALEL